MVPDLYLFNFAVISWHHKCISTSVTAVFVIVRFSEEKRTYLFEKLVRVEEIAVIMVDSVADKLQGMKCGQTVRH